MAAKNSDKTSNDATSTNANPATATSQEQTGQFRAAYESMAGERDALTEDKVLRINVDIPTAVNTVLGNLPAIEALEKEAKALPEFDIGSFSKLGTYAKALSYSQMLYVAASEPVQDVPVLAEQLAGERAKLLASAEALAARGFIDGSRLGDLKGGPGYKNIAYDVGTLVAMLRAAWPKVQDKTAVTQDELTNAQAQTETLLLAIAGREQQHVDTAAAGEQRSRAFTLLANAYDQVRRAVTFLRWGQSVDDIAPSIYSHARKASPDTTAAATDTAAAAPVAAKPAAEPGNGGAQPAPGMPGTSPYADGSAS
jgi:hypothetical protein